MFAAIPCDKSGQFLPPNTAPPDSPSSANNWSPFDNRVQFETADFLYRRNQMSAGQINELMELWEATFVKNGESSPFTNAKAMYDAIDAIPYGDAPWQRFTASTKDSHVPPDAPTWMKQEYDVWFRDPLTVIKNMLQNSDFDGEFDYVPFREYDGETNERRWKDFMSGNWAWDQAVRIRFCLSEIAILNIIF